VSASHNPRADLFGSITLTAPETSDGSATAAWRFPVPTSAPAVCGGGGAFNQAVQTFKELTPRLLKLFVR
jgi:hypothetical protein